MRLAIHVFRASSSLLSQVQRSVIVMKPLLGFLGLHCISTFMLLVERRLPHAGALQRVGRHAMQLDAIPLAFEPSGDESLKQNIRSVKLSGASTAMRPIPRTRMGGDGGECSVTHDTL